MKHPFDSLELDALRRRPSVKWQWYPDDVISCWVADMDFPVAEAIRDAIASYAAAGDLGYPPMHGLAGMREALVERMAVHHGMSLDPDGVMLLSGIIPGLYLANRALASEGDGVIVSNPIYPPFISAVKDTGRRLQWNPMIERDGRWEFDFDGLEEIIDPSTRLLMLCNPQNPTGRVFTRAELERLAEIVVRHRLWVVSDELHADLVLEGEHIPFASISSEVAQRTVTLYGPTKAFNIAGLKVGFAFSHNLDLMKRFRSAGQGLVVPANALGQVAAMAAWRDGDEWLRDTLQYLRANRDFLVSFVAERLPGVRVTRTEGTYLAWLDFSGCSFEGAAAAHLLEHARVGLNSGRDFAPESDGMERFARLNFATSRAILTEALERIERVVAMAVPG